MQHQKIRYTMGFYELSKKARLHLAAQINGDIFSGFKTNKSVAIITHFSNDDTYIRKAAYQAVGRFFNETLH